MKLDLKNMKVIKVGVDLGFELIWKKILLKINEKFFNDERMYSGHCANEKN